MLKSIVEQMDGDLESFLGELARAISARADDHRHTGQRPRQHQRLVARPRDVGKDVDPVGHDGHESAITTAPVSPRQDARPLPLLGEEARQVRDDRSFARAADAQVSDANHRLAQPALPRRVAPVPVPAPGRRGAVNGARDVNHSSLVFVSSWFAGVGNRRHGIEEA